MKAKNKIKAIIILCAAAALTGCSTGDFWKVSREKRKSSSEQEETTAEETTAEETTLSPADPVLDRHTRHIDLISQRNRKYRKKESYKTEYTMKGFGKIKVEDGSIFLELSVSEKELLVAPEIEGGKASIACQIDDIRFVYAVTVDDDIVKLGIYDLDSGENFVVGNDTNDSSYPYRPMCISGDYLILYTEDSSSGGNISYFRFDLDNYKMENYDSIYLSREWKSPSAAFSPDGKKYADISSGIENNGLYEYTVTLFSPDTGEKLNEFVIGSPEKHYDFSLEFRGNDCVYAYAGSNEGGWDDVYVINLWYGDGIVRINNKQEEYPDVKELNIAEPDESDSMDSLNQLIFFGNEGCYYNYRWNDTDDNGNYGYYGIGFDDGSGVPVPLEKDGYCIWSYIRDGILYGSYYPYDSVDHNVNIAYYVCKCEKNTVEIITGASNSAYACVYTPDHIYYLLSDEDTNDIYRMDYNGKNRKRILTLDGAGNMRRYMVSGSRIYYWYYDFKAAAEYQNVFGIYDMETGEHIRLRDGKIGRINGGYMYYIEENSYDLMRMNLEDYTIERVCRNVRCYDFQRDSIIYAIWNDDEHGVYRLNNEGSTQLFTTGDISGFQSDAWITGIQCRDDEIILKITSQIIGDGNYTSLVGTDQQGRLIREYGEKYKLPDTPRS